MLADQERLELRLERMGGGVQGRAGEVGMLRRLATEELRELIGAREAELRPHIDSGASMPMSPSVFASAVFAARTRARRGARTASSSTMTGQSR